MRYIDYECARIQRFSQRFSPNRFVRIHLHSRSMSQNSTRVGSNEYNMETYEIHMHMTQIANLELTGIVALKTFLLLTYWCY